MMRVVMLGAERMELLKRALEAMEGPVEPPMDWPQEPEEFNITDESLVGLPEWQLIVVRRGSNICWCDACCQAVVAMLQKKLGGGKPSVQTILDLYPPALELIIRIFFNTTVCMEATCTSLQSVRDVLIVEPCVSSRCTRRMHPQVFELHASLSRMDAAFAQHGSSNCLEQDRSTAEAFYRLFDNCYGDMRRLPLHRITQMAGLLGVSVSDVHPWASGGIAATCEAAIYIYHQRVEPCGEVYRPESCCLLYYR